MTPESARELLGVRPEADTGQINHAYRRLVRRHHPDVGGDPTVLLLVIDAREVLRQAERPGAITFVTSKWRRRRARLWLAWRRLKGVRRVR